MHQDNIYTFKYLAYKEYYIFILSGLGLTVLMFSYFNFIEEILGFFGLILVLSSISFPIALPFLFKNRIILNGKGAVESDFLILELANSTKKISFEEIKEYSIYVFRESRLKIRLQSGETIKVLARNLCDPSSLAEFLDYLEEKINDYQLRNPKVRIKRLKSLDEKLADWNEENKIRIRIFGLTCSISGVIFIFLDFTLGGIFSHIGFSIMAIHYLFKTFGLKKPSEDKSSTIKMQSVLNHVSLITTFIYTAVLLIGIDFYVTLIPGYRFLLGVGLCGLVVSIPMHIIVNIVANTTPKFSAFVFPGLIAIFSIAILLGYVNY